MFSVPPASTTRDLPRRIHAETRLQNVAENRAVGVRFASNIAASTRGGLHRHFDGTNFFQCAAEASYRQRRAATM
jgi:hypothetical protein